MRPQVSPECPCAASLVVSKLATVGLHRQPSFLAVKMQHVRRPCTRLPPLRPTSARPHPPTVCLVPSHLQFPAGFSRQYAGLAARCWAREPTKRPSSDQVRRLHVPNFPGRQGMRLHFNSCLLAGVRQPQLRPEILRTHPHAWLAWPDLLQVVSALSRMLMALRESTTDASAFLVSEMGRYPLREQPHAAPQPLPHHHYHAKQQQQLQQPQQQAPAQAPASQQQQQAQAAHVLQQQQALALAQKASSRRRQQQQPSDQSMPVQML